MSEVSLEEASRCPKCGEPGEETLNRVIRTGRLYGGRNIVFQCRNERCTWNGTGWNVSMSRDGKIRERPRGPKEFEFTPEMEAFANRQLEQMVENDPKLKAEYDRFMEGQDR